MPIVNYVREHTRFIEYATDEHLSASERLLWYALMHIMNQRAKGNEWPGEFIRVSNDRLISYCPMKYDTIAAARNSLKQRGLIDYQKGDKNKSSPAYRMIYFFPDEFYTENSDNIGDNIGGNMGGNIGDIYINNKRQETGNPNVIKREEEQQEEDRITRAREETADAWKAYFGKEASPAIQHAIAQQSVAYGFDIGIITRAVGIAATKDTDSPVDYISALFRDWSFQRIRTHDDLSEYQYLRDARNGKLPICCAPDDPVKALEDFRRAREENP